MENNIDYLEDINDKIFDANLLAKIPDINHPAALDLLKKRKKIKEKNGLFVFWELKRIDKKINALKK